MIKIEGSRKAEVHRQTVKVLEINRLRKVNMVSKKNTDSQRHTEVRIEGTGTIRSRTFGPHTFNLHTIHHRMLYPGVLRLWNISSLKCGTIFRVRFG